MGTHPYSLDGAVPSLCREPKAKLSALSTAKAQASLPHSSPSSSSPSSPSNMKNHNFLAFRALAAWEVDSVVCAPWYSTPALQVKMVLPLILKFHKSGAWLCFLSSSLCFKPFFFLYKGNEAVCCVFTGLQEHRALKETFAILMTKPPSWQAVVHAAGVCEVPLQAPA